MKSFYLLLIATVISFTSCRTKEGTPGPAGESSLNKQGSVSGIITYTDDNGNAATTPFNYQYFESLEDNVFSYENNGQSLYYYNLNFGRRDLKDNNNYLAFAFGGTSTNGIESAPTSTGIEFSLYTIINNEVYYFSNSSRTGLTITNVSLDPNTGRVTFDFSGTVYLDGIASTVTGRVDVTLNRERINQVA